MIHVSVSLKQVAALTLVVFGLYLAFEASKMRILLAIGPGPGFFPLIFALVLVIAVILYMFEKAPAEPTTTPPSTRGLVRLLVVLVGLASVVLLIDYVGFRLTMFGLQLLILTTLGMRNVPLVMLTAFVGSFGIYYAFVEILRVQLPAGVLGLFGL